MNIKERTEDIRWGILGCGDVTEIKSGPALQQAEGSTVVAVMRRTGRLAKDYAQRHQVPTWYDRADQLINDPNVNAIYIATPPGSHQEYAFQAAQAGKPAYVEKPMARNHEECQKMVDDFRKRNLGLFIAYYRRELPRFLKAKQIVDSGKLGTITGVQYHYHEPMSPDLDTCNLSWRLVAQESGGGLFFDLGSHALDLIDFLLGPLESVHGMASNQASCYEVEDSVAVHFRMGCGSLGVAFWNFASSVHRDLIEITGTQGRLSLSVFANEAVRLDLGDQTECFDIAHPKHIQQPMIQTVVDSLLGHGTCCSTGESAARTALVMDKVVSNYYGDRSGEFWNTSTTWPDRKAIQDECSIRG